MNTEDQISHVLIISASERRFELQKALCGPLQSQVTVAATFQEAAAAVAMRPYLGVVLDEGLADLDPTEASHFLSRCNLEVPIFVKLAITGLPRCVQQIELAFRRFERERQIATTSAQHSISAQVRDALTSIMIHGQLALNSPGIPQDAVRRIELILEGADALQTAIGPRPD